MSFVCVLPKTIGEADQNYLAAQKAYQIKKEAIVQKIKSEYDISGDSFIQLIQQNLLTNMKEKIVSPESGRSVGYDTILKHLYDAVQASAYSIIESHQAEISSLSDAIATLQQQAIANGKSAQKNVEKQIDDIIQQFANEMQLDSVIYKYLPEFISSANAQLSFSQVFGYAKSIFKHEISKRIAGVQIQDIFQRHPGIILGYIREDAVADASQKAISKLSMTAASAATVGAAKSKIDILISLTGQGSAISQNGELLGGLLASLDKYDKSFSVTGESSLETDEFLGIQSKPWKLFLPTTSWNKNSIGSRAELLNNFLSSGYNPAGADNQYSWHAGVLYLSTQLEEVIGVNTVMYVTGNSIIWTNELFDQLRKYNKYFAFMLTSNNQLTSHVQLADHYG